MPAAKKNSKGIIKEQSSIMDENNLLPDDI
jgi:hypothetical protein